MTEIEFKLLQSLRASDPRGDFTVDRADHTRSRSTHETASTSDVRRTSIEPAHVIASTSDERRASVALLYGELTEAVIGAAIEVHRSLGPGQLESTYQRALAKELAYCGIRHRAQVPITSWYRDEPVGEFFADFIVEDKIILELKVVSRILPVHRAQVVSYLRATGLQLGLVLNFHVPVLVMGVKRVSP
jgi:GxxExxY protein